MADHLELEALARIQAEEARPETEAFRTRWLDGAAFTNWRQALSWSLEQLDAPGDVIRVSLHIPSSLDTRYTLAVGPTPLAVRHDMYEWVGFDVGGNVCARYQPEKGAMRDLGGLTALLSLRYRWPVSSTLRFVLCDEAPELEPVTAQKTHQYAQMPQNKGVPDNLGLYSYVTGPYSEEILLRCRPQATTSDVKAAYQEARRRLFDEPRITPLERIRPMTSPRVRDLAVLGGLIALGRFKTWGDAYRAYQAKHPEDRTYRKQPTPNAGLFRRDVKAAYLKATGCILDFKPVKEGGPAKVTRQIQLED